MIYIKDFNANDVINGTYLCKNRSEGTTKKGDAFVYAELADRTGSIRANIWKPSDPGISEFETGDFVNVSGTVINFGGNLNVTVYTIRKAEDGTYDPADYVPQATRPLDEMVEELNCFIGSVRHPHLKHLLQAVFINGDNGAFQDAFIRSSAAEHVHHATMGGLLEHTLSVAAICDHMASRHPSVNRDFIITIALLHDIGKVAEISDFPENKFTDAGRFLGHVFIGAETIGRKARELPGFPEYLIMELQHAILSHHGSLEYGSPKLPCLIEARILASADEMDAKATIFDEKLSADTTGTWLQYDKYAETAPIVTKL